MASQSKIADKGIYNAIDIVKASQILQARSKVEALEDLIKQDPDHVEGDSDLFPLTHTFCDGIYVREIFLPKGSTCVGKLHKTQHPNILMQGEVLVTSDRSEEGVHLKAPMYFISEAGMKKVVHAVEDSVWLTIHATDKKTPEEAEMNIIAKTYKDLPDHIKREIPCLS